MDLNEDTKKTTSFPSKQEIAKTPKKLLHKLACQKWKFNKNFVTEQIEQLFYKQGLLVGKHPYIFLILPIIVTCALSIGLLKLRVGYDVYPAYSPANAPSAREYKIFLDYFDDTGGVFFFALGFTATDGGSVLREQYRKDILYLLNYFETNYTVLIDGKNYTFDQLQINHKDDNKIPKLALEYYNSSKIPITVTYPMMTLNNDQYYLGLNWRNVTVDPKTKIVKEMSTILFILNSARGDAYHTQLLRQWAHSFLYLNNTLDAFPNLTIYFWSDDVNAEEIMRNAFVMTPFIILGFGVLIIFACLISWSKDPVYAKPWESLTSILCVLLSSGASFGILFFANFEFQGLLVTSPVLVLALGMDVTYITLRTWRSTDRNQEPHIRLAETFSEAGPSIVITTLTNLLSAGLGCMTSVPVTYMFCLSIVFAVGFLFILQITLFAAAIALGARREARKKHGFLCCVQPRASNLPKKPNSLPDIVSSTTKVSDWWNSVSKVLSMLLCTNYCRILVVIALMFHLAASIYCCTRVKVGLTPERLLLPDSKLLRMLKLDRDTMQPDNGEPLYVIVLNPPNLSNKTEQDNMENMVKEFESLPGCLSSSVTSFWLRQFRIYSEFFDDDDKEASFNSSVVEYLNTQEGSRWKNYIVFDHTNNQTINRFMFSVVYRRTKDFEIRSKYTDNWRALTLKYSRYNISSWFFDNYNFITDQLESIAGNIVQDLVITGVCMSFICMLFIPNIFSTICSVLTIFSINIGVFGYLINWDATLDPVTMIAFLIAIGYSVDFISHISFHYYISDGGTQQAKLYSALSSIGLPMLETGVSTVLCVGCISFTGGYMITVFVKSIFLVVLIGLIHGLIILPTILAWIPINVLDKLFASRIHQVQEPSFTVQAKPEIVLNTEPDSK